MGVGGFASTRPSLKETITSFDKQLRNAFEQQVREPEQPSRMGAGDHNNCSLLPSRLQSQKAALISCLNFILLFFF